MKKLVLACALLAAFAFVGCKSNKTAAPVEAAEAPTTEEVAVAPADSAAVCPETGKVCDEKAEGEKVCEKKAE